MSQDMQAVQEKIQALKPLIESALSEAAKVVVGQRFMLERLLMGILLEGHILVEGVPGLAKTTAVKALAKVLDAKFQRIQFTPDLLPADLIGTQIYNPKTQDFAVKKGPLFANIILADEINRAPAKVQSALLEAMQERQVTIGEETFKLTSPFVVLATQNPIEQEGTYPLPEAQVDRFMLKLKVEYPTSAEEVMILEKSLGASWEAIHPQLNFEKLTHIKLLLDQVYVDPKIKDYIVRIVSATRSPGELDEALGRYVQFGASPRGSIDLYRLSRCWALMEGRAYVIPQDVKTMALDVLRHRVLLSYVAEAEELSSDEILGRLLERVEVP